MALWNNFQSLWQPKPVPTPTQALKPGPVPYSSYMPGYGGRGYGPVPYSSYMPGYGQGAGSVAGATTTPSGGGGGAAAPTTTTSQLPSIESILGPAPSESQVKEQVSASYEPIMAELDRRLGGLPSEQAGVESYVGELAGTQGAGAEAAKERSLGALGVERTGEMGRSKQTLRDLAENARNILEAAQNVWGGSSAVPAVTTGIGKAVTKERGKVLGTRDQALRVLDQKVTDVGSIFNEAMRGIETWKSNQLLNVGQEFRSREDALRGLMGEAAQQEAQQWANYAMQQLANFDQMVNQYKMNVETWKAQREGELQDYIAKLQAYAQYTPAQYSYVAPGLTGPAESAAAPAGGTLSPGNEDLWKQLYGGG